MISLEVKGSKGSEGSEGFSNEPMNATVIISFGTLRTFSTLRTLRTFAAEDNFAYFA